MSDQITFAPPRAADQAEGLRRLLTLPRRLAGRAAEAPRPERRSCPVVAIASGKGGVGKTSLAVNLAVALARTRRVTLVDADPGLANADVLLGVAPRRRLDAALSGSGSLADLSVEAPGGVRLVPGSVGVAELVEPGDDARSRLIEGLADLEEVSDLVLVDCGAGLGRLTISLLAAADLGVVVLTPEPTSIADAYALVKLVVRGGYAGPAAAPGAHVPLALVVNEARSRGEGDVVHGRVRGVALSRLGYEPEALGTVRFDPAVGDACRRRRPLMLERPRSRGARDIAALAEAITLRAGACSRPAPERA